MHTTNREKPLPGAQPGEGKCPPHEIFKTLHSNFDICRNFQTMKLKFCILIIFKESFTVLEFFFVLLVNYLLSGYILRQAI